MTSGSMSSIAVLVKETKNLKKGVMSLNLDPDLAHHAAEVVSFL